MDIEHQREVSKHEGIALAQMWNSPFMEASAKNRLNVNEVFTEIVREMCYNSAKEKPNYCCSLRCCILWYPGFVHPLLWFAKMPSRPKPRWPLVGQREAMWRAEYGHILLSSLALESSLPGHYPLCIVYFVQIIKFIFYQSAAPTSIGDTHLRISSAGRHLFSLSLSLSLSPRTIYFWIFAFLSNPFGDIFQLVLRLCMLILILLFWIFFTDFLPTIKETHSTVWLLASSKDQRQHFNWWNCYGWMNAQLGFAVDQFARSWKVSRARTIFECSNGAGKDHWWLPSWLSRWAESDIVLSLLHFASLANCLPGALWATLARSWPLWPS